MQAVVRQAVDSFVPVTLDEVRERSPLLTRVDKKYVVNWRFCGILLEALLDDFSILDIQGRRTFGYQTIYFDTDSLTLYRAHVQGRRKRFKCRSRYYLDSGTRFFEVKMKGPRGETIKKQMAYDWADATVVTADAWQFLRDCLSQQYGQHFDENLTLSLRNEYRRITFVARGGVERLTCDFDLSFDDSAGRSGRLSSDFVVLESKSTYGDGMVDSLLKAIGVRPLTCSKYCAGTALLRPGVKSNDLRWLLSRYFESDAKTVASLIAKRRPQEDVNVLGAAARLPHGSATVGAAAVNGRVELHTSPAAGSQRNEQRASLTVITRISTATIVVIANVASAYGLCKLASPLICPVVAISVAYVEGKIAWMFAQRRRRRYSQNSPLDGQAD